MSFTALIAALSDRYSWKKRMTLPTIASADIERKMTAIALTGCTGNFAAMTRPAIWCHGTAGSSSVVVIGVAARGLPIATVARSAFGSDSHCIASAAFALAGRLSAPVG